MKNGIETDAYVVWIDEEKDENNIIYYPTYQYSDNAGNKHQYKSKVSFPNLEFPRNVPITYNPKHPKIPYFFGENRNRKVGGYVVSFFILAALTYVGATQIYPQFVNSN